MFAPLFIALLASASAREVDDEASCVAEAELQRDLDALLPPDRKKLTADAPPPRDEPGEAPPPPPVDAPDPLPWRLRPAVALGGGAATAWDIGFNRPEVAVLPAAGLRASLALRADAARRDGRKNARAKTQRRQGFLGGPLLRRSVALIR